MVVPCNPLPRPRAFGVFEAALAARPNRSAQIHKGKAGSGARQWQRDEPNDALPAGGEGGQRHWLVPQGYDRWSHLFAAINARKLAERIHNCEKTLTPIIAKLG